MYLVTIEGKEEIQTRVRLLADAYEWLCGRYQQFPCFFRVARTIHLLVRQAQNSRCCFICQGRQAVRRRWARGVPISHLQIGG